VQNEMDPCQKRLHKPRRRFWSRYRTSSWVYKGKRETMWQLAHGPRKPRMPFVTMWARFRDLRGV
jgi:hypothetical protein